MREETAAASSHTLLTDLNSLRGGSQSLAAEDSGQEGRGGGAEPQKQGLRVPPTAPSRALAAAQIQPSLKEWGVNWGTQWEPYLKHKAEPAPQISLEISRWSLM